MVNYPILFFRVSQLTFSIVVFTMSHCEKCFITCEICLRPMMLYSIEQARQKKGVLDSRWEWYVDTFFPSYTPADDTHWLLGEPLGFIFHCFYLFCYLQSPYCKRTPPTLRSEPIKLAFCSCLICAYSQ